MSFRMCFVVMCVGIASFYAGSHANGQTTVSGYIPFNTIVTGDQTSASFTHQFIANDGMGNTATIDLTLSSANGELFNKLDGNTRLSIGTTPDDENHVNVGEDPSFVASLVSQTGTLTDVGFNISSLGLRDTGSPSVSWTSDVSTTPVVLNSLTGESDRGMDSAVLFHTLNASDYAGTLEVLSGQFQFTENGAASNGVGFTVQFSAPTPAAVPEPASMAIWSLLGVALTAFGYYRVHRRR